MIFFGAPSFCSERSNFFSENFSPVIINFFFTFRLKTPKKKDLMSTLATLIQTFQGFDSVRPTAEPSQRDDPRLLRQRNTCKSCGACALDLYDANQREQKQKNLNTGLQRLLDMERADHDKLKAKHIAMETKIQDRERADRELEEIKAALAQRELEYQALRQHMQEIAAHAAKARSELDRPDESDARPRKKAKH